MSSLNRRTFLKALSAAALTDSVVRASEIQATRVAGTVDDVQHVVVLMQENRSFDHFFGTMRGVRGFGDPRPVILPSGNPVFNQSGVLPFHPQDSGLGMRHLAGLDHDWNGGHSAWNSGRYDNWVPAKSALTMAHFTRDDIPFHHALADAFTICDAYHCSFIGATDPNRYYMFTGYTGNDGTGGGPVLGNQESGYGWTTYAERLQQAGVSWKVYQDTGLGLDGAPGHNWGWTEDAFIGNYGDTSLLYFNSYRNAQPGSPLYDRARTGTAARNGGTYFDVLRDDVVNDRLPQVSYVSAPEAFSEHPNWPVNYGAWYVSKVLEALTANPAVWSKTVLFVTYDENDGFFDHVVPPYPPKDANWGLSTADPKNEWWGGANGYVSGPYGLGPRVPMIVVSPWSKGGYVCSEVFDHTSIIRFMERRFGVREPNISPWRRALCGDLTSAFDFSLADPALPSLPGTGGYVPPDHNRHGNYSPSPPGSPQPLKQEPGLRYARPLPYELNVVSRVDVAAKRISFTWTSGAKTGAHFYVQGYNRTDGPWTYTVSAGKSVSDSWMASKGYKLTMWGPNGFLRTFNGSVAGPEVGFASSAGKITLTFTSAQSCQVTVRNAYTGASVSLAVAGGSQVTHVVDPGASHGWYDVTVTTDADSGWLRRLAGHLENGQVSTSDPAIHV